MNLTVRDILSLGGLRDASIVAGNGGVNNIVDSISVLEVADSNISKWVLKNELYITSFYAIHTNIEKQKEVIRALHKSGGCGLVLCHIDMWIKDIDKEIIELCNTIDFPLIVANSEVSYVEILNPIIEKLMKINIDNFQLLLSTQNKLIEQVANKEELEDIFNNISSMFEQEILFLDLDNNCIFSKNADKNTIKTVEDYLRLNFNTINSECDKFNYCIKNIGQKKKVLYPIKTIGKFYGFVVVGYEEERFEHTLRKIENIAKICTLIYTKKSRIQELEEINIQDYIGDLITWNFRSEEVALKAGLDINWDIVNKTRLMIININSIQENLSSKGVKDIQNYAKKVLYPTLSQEVKYSNPNNLIGFRSDVVFILLHSNNDKIKDKDKASSLGQRILKICNNDFIGSVSIGISNHMEEVTEIPKAYKEATSAAIMGRNLFGENRVVKYNELGFFPLLKDLKFNDDIRVIIDYLLAPLIDYDRANGTDLIETLKNLLDNNMNISTVAKDMYLHKNTVLYRKNKITEILNDNPFEMPYTLNYLLAFMINSL